MHDGSMKTLAEVVDFHAGGGRANPRLDSRIRPIELTTAQRASLVAFLNALTGSVRDGWR